MCDDMRVEYNKVPEGFVLSRPDVRVTRLLPRIAHHINASLTPPKVLDYGCGEGHLSRFLSSKTRLTLFDVDPEMLSIAERNAAQSPVQQVDVVVGPEDIPDDCFDFVVLSLVLVAIPSEATIQEVMNHCKRALKPNGTLVIATTHPCFRDRMFSTFHTNYLTEPFPYKESGTEFDVYLCTQRQDEFIVIHDTHRTLSWYSNLLRSNGMHCLLIDEVLDDSELIPERFNSLVPPFVVFLAQLTPQP